MVRRRPARGSTLAELVVTAFVFSLLMTLIAGVYVEGTRITRRQDKYSASYRRVVGLLEKVEAMLTWSRVYRVEQDQVLFSPLPEAAPVVDGRPAWPAEASTLRYDRSGPRPRLWLVEGGTARVVLQMESEDWLFFSANDDLSVVYVTAKSDPLLDPSRQEGRARSTVAEGEVPVGNTPLGLQLTRHILVENGESY